MEKAGRFPNLGHLSIAVIESMVKPVIGDESISVIKAPLEEVRLRKSLQEVLIRVERKFIESHENKDLTGALLNLPFHNLGSLQEALRGFYENPASADLAKLLAKRLVSEFKSLKLEEINNAVEEYLKILRREIIPLSEQIRQKLQVSSLLDIQENIQSLSKSFDAFRSEKQVVLGLSPSVPSLVVGRESDIRELKARLGMRTPLIVNSHLQVLTAIRGWPGVGKTTVAAVLAHDYDIADNFPDGVLWISLGPKPDLLMAISMWGRSLGEDFLKYSDVKEASSRLSEMLRSKKMLIVIDDVWEAEHAIPFLVGGKGCATLVTTRENNVALALAPTARDIYRLPVLTEENSILLLQELAPDAVAKHRDQCRQLASDLEGLPLALQVAGHMLNVEENYGNPSAVIDLLHDLRDTSKILEAKAPADKTEVENETTPKVAALLLKSTDRLDNHTRDCFAYLGVFAPKPATFDSEVLKKMWQVDDPMPIVRKLIDHGLMEPVASTGRFQLHALLVAHAKSLLNQG